MIQLRPLLQFTASVYEFSDLIILWDDEQHSKTAEPHCVTFFPLKTGSDDRLAIVFSLFACCQCEGISALNLKTK